MDNQLPMITPTQFRTNMYQQIQNLSHGPIQIKGKTKAKSAIVMDIDTYQKGQAALEFKDHLDGHQLNVNMQHAFAVIRNWQVTKHGREILRELGYAHIHGLTSNRLYPYYDFVPIGLISNTDSIANVGLMVMVNNDIELSLQTVRDFFEQHSAQDIYDLAITNLKYEATINAPSDTPLESYSIQDMYNIGVERLRHEPLIFNNGLADELAILSHTETFDSDHQIPDTKLVQLDMGRGWFLKLMQSD